MTSGTVRRKRMKKLIKWVAFDGLLHIETSALIVIVVSLLLPWWAGSIVAAVAGIGKEWYDRAKGGPFSSHDLICDLFGIICGSLVAWLSIILFV